MIVVRAFVRLTGLLSPRGSVIGGYVPLLSPGRTLCGNYKQIFFLPNLNILSLPIWELQHWVTIATSQYSNSHLQLPDSHSSLDQYIYHSSTIAHY